MGSGAAGQKKKIDVKQEAKKSTEVDEIKEQEKIYQQVQQQRAALKNEMAKSNRMVEINTDVPSPKVNKSLPPVMTEEEIRIQEQRRIDQQNLDYFNNLNPVASKKVVKTVSYNNYDMDDDLQGFDINKMRKANFTANNDDDENNLFKKVL